MKKTITTEEFFYDNCDILTKKITTVEEYEEQILGGSTPITPYPFSPPSNMDWRPNISNRYYW